MFLVLYGIYSTRGAVFPIQCAFTTLWSWYVVASKAPALARVLHMDDKEDEPTKYLPRKKLATLTVIKVGNFLTIIFFNGRTWLLWALTQMGVHV